MDLIYTNKQREDVGVMKDYAFDLAFGSDENDFELVVDIKNHCCEPNCLVYIEGTEYGGIVDRINVVTKEDRLAYVGRTWHGILASKIITPNAGEDYLTVGNEEAYIIVADLIDKLGLSDLFIVEVNPGHVIPSYSFDRYIDAYSGLKKMLASFSMKMRFSFKNGKVVISILPVVDYCKDEQFDNDQVGMTIEKAYNTTNHLICLGKGELATRQVVHLYKDADGNIGEIRTFTGLQEIVRVYDYPNVESLEELKKSGIENFQEELSAEETVQMDFATEENIYDIGDIVGAKEITTGIYASEKITKKIVTINQGLVNIQYKVGE